MSQSLPQRQFHLVAPLFILSGLCIGVMPLLHPNNTCHDWLQKWGQLSSESIWVPIHQVSMAGYALGAAAAFALPFLAGRRTATGFAGGAALGAALAILAMVSVIHATAVSALGEAFNAATSEESRRMIRLAAEAWVRWDTAACGVAAALLAIGTSLTIWLVYRSGALSPLAALVFLGIGLVWSLQALGALRPLHIPVWEWIPFGSLSGWLCGLGLIFLFDRRGAGAA
jgi:phosphotransferase system  glucose/maltose/N-acetylglucosamine-specific IIC component